MTVWVWLSIAVAASLLVVYPYAIYPLLLKLLPHKSDTLKTMDNNQITSVSLLFCAYNEASSLPEKIENLKHLKSVLPQLKVYAYSDASTDETNNILMAASHILKPVIGIQRKGKVAGMNKLVSMTNTEIIVFTDANVILEADGLLNLVNYFKDPEIGCVSGTLLYRGIDSTTAKVGGVYWKLEEHIKKLESQTGSMMGADGAIFARRRTNYPSIPYHLVDDMAVSMQVIFDGMRCISAPDVIAYENAVTNSSEEFKRKKRIACGSYSTYLHQKNDLKKMALINKFKFFSHKLIRWWGALFLIITFLSLIMLGFSLGIGSSILIVTFICAVIFILLGKTGVPVISPIYEIIIAIFATGLGVIEALRKKRYETWNTANSR